MPWTKLPPEDVAKVRTVRVSDRIMALVERDHGNLSNYMRQYERIAERLAELCTPDEVLMADYNRKNKLKKLNK